MPLDLIAGFVFVARQSDRSAWASVKKLDDDMLFPE